MFYAMHIYAYENYFKLGVWIVKQKSMAVGPSGAWNQEWLCWRRTRATVYQTRPEFCAFRTPRIRVRINIIYTFIDRAICGLPLVWPPWCWSRETRKPSIVTFACVRYPTDLPLTQNWPCVSYEILLPIYVIVVILNGIVFVRTCLMWWLMGQR
jgi:hypothetical protein